MPFGATQLSAVRELAIVYPGKDVRSLCNAIPSPGRPDRAEFLRSTAQGIARTAERKHRRSFRFRFSQQVRLVAGMTGRGMDFPNWIPPDLHWMFWGRAEPPHDGVSSGEPWTEREDYFLSRFYPCHWKLHVFLPGRSVMACRKRARRLHIVRKPFDRWSYEERRWLKANYAKATWLELQIGLPKRSLHSIRAKALDLHLHRGRIDPDNFSVELLRIVINKARELNYSVRDLDEEASMKGYFSSYEPSAWVRVDAVIKAINAMGGELRIHWYGEARGVPVGPTL